MVADIEEHAVDGRTARRDRNKNAVLDAVVELFAEGDLEPGVHEVAERSGVSLRSVYRYFEDTDDLIESAINRFADRARLEYAAPEPDKGDFEERLARFCDHRVRFFEGTRTVYKAALHRAGIDPRTQAAISLAQTELRTRTLAMFSPELDQLPDDHHVHITLDALTQMESLEYLCATLEICGADLELYLARAVRSMLGR